MTDRPAPSRRADFPFALVVPTRWADNDVYGHVNNAAYYGFVDTAVNRYLTERARLDWQSGPLIALVVETGCRYHAALHFPQDIEVALRVARVGTSSVTWRAGLFPAPAPADAQAAADVLFVHVLVDRQSRRPVPWPPAMREALEAAIAPPPGTS